MHSAPVLTGTYSAPARGLALAYFSAATIFMLLIKASATVTVYRGHCQSFFFLPGIISLSIICIGIIRNTSLVAGRTWDEVRTPATEHVKQYSTWRPNVFNHWATRAGFNMVTLCFTVKGKKIKAFHTRC